MYHIWYQPALAIAGAGFFIGTKMGRKKEFTQKNENYCQFYVKIGSKAKAYELSYDCSTMVKSTINQRAHELHKDPRIQERIKEIQREALERTTMDAAWVVEQHRQLYEECRAGEQYAQATRNLEGIGKTMGIYTDNLNVTGDLRDISDEDLDKRIRELARKVQAENSARGKGTPPTGK